jgi:hypothetical protein
MRKPGCSTIQSRPQCESSLEQVVNRVSIPKDGVTAILTAIGRRTMGLKMLGRSSWGSTPKLKQQQRQRQRQRQLLRMQMQPRTRYPPLPASRVSCGDGVVIHDAC